VLEAELIDIVMLDASEDALALCEVFKSRSSNPEVSISRGLQIPMSPNPEVSKSTSPPNPQVSKSTSPLNPQVSKSKNLQIPKCPNPEVFKSRDLQIPRFPNPEGLMLSMYSTAEQMTPLFRRMTQEP